MHFIKEQGEKDRRGTLEPEVFVPFLSAIAREMQLPTQTKEMQGKSCFF